MMKTMPGATDTAVSVKITTVANGDNVLLDFCGRFALSQPQSSTGYGLVQKHGRNYRLCVIYIAFVFSLVVVIVPRYLFLVLLFLYYYSTHSLCEKIEGGSVVPESSTLLRRSSK